MNISVIYAHPDRPQWVKLDMAEGATVTDAIRNSQLLERYPEIELSSHKTGIFGKLVKLDHVLKCGDRVEIYTPIIVDPKSVTKRAKPQNRQD